MNMNNALKKDEDFTEILRDIARKLIPIGTLIQQELNLIKLAYDPTSASLINSQWLYLIRSVSRE